MAPAGSGHGSIANRIAYLLTQHVYERELGDVFAAETGFRLAADTMRAPDVSFVAKSRISPTGLPAGFWPGAPDLAVEVLSPDDRAEDVDEKIDDYLDAGCQLVWIVNPKRKTITVHRPNQNPVILRAPDTLDGGDVVPGFTCRVGDIFP